MRNFPNKSATLPKNGISAHFNFFFFFGEIIQRNERVGVTTLTLPLAESFASEQAQAKKHFSIEQKKGFIPQYKLVTSSATQVLFPQSSLSCSGCTSTTAVCPSISVASCPSYHC